VCRRHGIAPNLFYRWKDEAEQERYFCSPRLPSATISTLTKQQQVEGGPRLLVVVGAFALFDSASDYVEICRDLQKARIAYENLSWTYLAGSATQVPVAP